MREGGLQRFDAFKKKANEVLDEPVGLTRREVLIGGGALVAAGGLAGEAVEHALFALHSPESRIERNCEPGELFERQQKAFRQVYGKLTQKEILFLDSYAGAIGAPYIVEPIQGIDPGVRDAQGNVHGEIHKEWLLAARRDVLAKHPEIRSDISKDEPRQTNTISLVRGANAANPEIKAKTLVDVAKFYGDQEVVGVRGTTRIAYVTEHINKPEIVSAKTLTGERPTIPFPLSKTVLDEFARIVPGQAAQESQYNNTSLSKVGAQGIFQFMPATWKGLWKKFGLTEPGAEHLPAQVDGVKLYMIDAYNRLHTKYPSMFAKVEQEFFDGNKADFEKYFLTPVLINTYNSGTDRVAHVVGWFLEHFPTKAVLEKQIGTYESGFGYDVYTAMTHEAYTKKAVSGYGKDSSEYVMRSMAFASLLEK